MSVFTLVGCAWEAVDERITQLTRAEPSERRQQASRRLTLAQAYFEEQQWSAAHQEVRASLLIDPDQAQAYSLLGLIYQQQAQPEMAIKSFQTALDVLRANDVPTQIERALIEHNYAWLLCQQKREVEAIALWEDVLQLPLYPQRFKTWQALGLCWVQAGQPQRARGYFELMLTQDPLNAIATYELAREDYLQRQWQAAKQRLDQLHAAGVASASTLWLAIRISRDTQNTQEQLALTQRLRQQFPQSNQTRWLDQLSFEQL
jgi:type IV pilus assembly protein PilF